MGVLSRLLLSQRAVSFYAYFPVDFSFVLYGLFLFSAGAYASSVSLRFRNFTVSAAPRRREASGQDRAKDGEEGYAKL